MTGTGPFDPSVAAAHEKRRLCKVDVVGAETVLSRVARAWLAECDGAGAPLAGGMPRIIFAAEAGPALEQHLKTSREPVVIYPGPTSLLTTEAIRGLRAAGNVARILCDRLPDEGPPPVDRGFWEAVHDVAFFPAWPSPEPACEPDKADRRGVMWVEAAQPWRIVTHQHGNDHVFEVDSSQLVAVLRDAGLMRDESKIAADEPASIWMQTASRHAVIVAGTDDVETVLWCAATARRTGAVFVDWAAMISPLRQILEDWTESCEFGGPFPWAGLRTGLRSILGKAAGALKVVVAGVGRSWLDVLNADIGTAVPQDDECRRALRVHHFIREALAGKYGSAGWSSAHLWQAVMYEGLFPAARRTAAFYRGLDSGIARLASSLSAEFGLAWKSGGEVLELFQALVAARPGAGGIVAQGIFDGVCDGYLFDWRRPTAEAAKTMAVGVRRMAPRMRIVRASLALALEDASEFARDWRSLREQNLKLSVLRRVLRTWMPLLDGRDARSIRADIVAAYLTAMLEVEQAAPADPGCVHLAAASTVYLLAADEAEQHLLEKSGTALSPGANAGLAMMAWLCQREALARQIWARFCRDQPAAEIRERFPLAIARALIEREATIVRELDEIESVAPEYFAPAMPSNTRCFFLGLAYRALGSVEKAAEWHRRALERDPAAEARENHFQRLENMPT